MSSALQEPVSVNPRPTGRVTGKVLRFNRSSGYGFIQQDNAPPGSPDVFLHASSLPTDVKDAIEEGTRVSFTIGQGSRGPKAERVALLDTPAPRAAKLSAVPDQLTQLEFGAEFGAVLERLVPDRARRAQVLESLCAAARRHHWITE